MATRFEKFDAATMKRAEAAWADEEISTHDWCKRFRLNHSATLVMRDKFGPKPYVKLISARAISKAIRAKRQP